MGTSVLIVEGEFLAAIDLSHRIDEFGYACVGIAPDQRSALELAGRHPVDVALVDINLRDGPTGPARAEALTTQFGATAVFVTGNIGMAPCIAGCLGAIGKPVPPRACGPRSTRRRGEEPALMRRPRATFTRCPDRTPCRAAPEGSSGVPGDQAAETPYLYGGGVTAPGPSNGR